MYLCLWFCMISIIIIILFTYRAYGRSVWLIISNLNRNAKRLTHLTHDSTVIYVLAVFKLFIFYIWIFSSFNFVSYQKNKQTNKKKQNKTSKTKQKNQPVLFCFVYLRFMEMCTSQSKNVRHFIFFSVIFIASVKLYTICPQLISRYNIESIFEWTL